MFFFKNSPHTEEENSYLQKLSHFDKKKKKKKTLEVFSLYTPYTELIIGVHCKQFLLTNIVSFISQDKALFITKTSGCLSYSSKKTKYSLEAAH